MQTRMMGVIVAGILLAGAAAMAQTAGAPVESTSRSIIPVTGPSTAPSPSEPAKPEVTPAVAQGEVANSEGARKGTTGRPTVSATAASHPVSHSTKSVKTVHTPVAKTTVKKVPATKHVAKATGSQKTKHVTAVKHQWSTHHAAVGKPIPVSKHQPAAKGATPAQPVLPRV